MVCMFVSFLDLLSWTISRYSRAQQSKTTLSLAPSSTELRIYCRTYPKWNIYKSSSWDQKGSVRLIFPHTNLNNKNTRTKSKYDRGWKRTTAACEDTLIFTILSPKLNIAWWIPVVWRQHFVLLQADLGWYISIKIWLYMHRKGLI